MAVLRDDDLPRTVYETSKVNVDNAKIAVMKYIHYPLADGHGRAVIFLFEVLGKKDFICTNWCHVASSMDIL